MHNVELEQVINIVLITGKLQRLLEFGTSVTEHSSVWIIVVTVIIIIIILGVDNHHPFFSVLPSLKAKPPDDFVLFFWNEARLLGVLPVRLGDFQHCFQYFHSSL